MIARSFLQERVRYWHHSSTLLVVVLIGAALTLHGCGGKTGVHTIGKRQAAKDKKAAKLAKPGETIEDDEDSEEVEDNSDLTNQNPDCDVIVKSKSDDYQKAMQAEAPTYYNGVVKTFSLDFVRYPFCLESNYFIVHKLEHKMRGNDKYKLLPSASFQEKLNKSITDQFSKHKEQWQSMCQDWAERNKAHQLANLKMVRTVLGFKEDIPTEKLKAEIQGWFGWQPWWDFFRSITQSGCVRRYTQRCVRSAKVAHRYAKQLVIQTMGDHNMTWHAFDAPSDSFLQAGEEWKHQVPIELRAGGQQFMSRGTLHAN